MDPLSLIVSAAIKGVTDSLRDTSTPISSDQPRQAARDVAANIAAQAEVKQIVEATGPIPWWRSQVFVGGLAVVLAEGFKLAGIVVTPDTMTEVVRFGMDVIALSGAGLALYGRVKSPVQPITATSPSA